MENEGVTPDIILDTSPIDQAKGRDPQLDRAIDLILKNIKEKPVKLAAPPKPPVKLK
jgi:tricorn protease